MERFLSGEHYPGERERAGMPRVQAERLSGWVLLLVEDDFWVATEVQRVLEAAGADVLGPAPTVDAALDLIDDHGERLHAAVLDVNLGAGETSRPVAERLTELEVPYVFATGESTLADVPCFRGRPRVGKPVGDRELVAALLSVRPT